MRMICFSVGRSLRFQKFNWGVQAHLAQTKHEAVLSMIRETHPCHVLQQGMSKYRHGLCRVYSILFFLIFMYLYYSCLLSIVSPSPTRPIQVQIHIEIQTITRLSLPL